MKGDEEQAEKRWQRYISPYLPISPRRRGGSAPRERRLREAPLLEVARLLHTQWGTRVAGAAGAPGESSRGREAWGGAGRRGEARGGAGRRGEARGGEGSLLCARRDDARVFEEELVHSGGAALHLSCSQLEV